MSLVVVDIKKRFLSAAECFLGEFVDAAVAGDRMGAALASARLSQLGLCMFELFSAGASTLAGTVEEHKACHETAILVRDLLEKSLEKWERMGQGERPN